MQKPSIGITKLKKNIIINNKSRINYYFSYKIVIYENSLILLTDN